MQDFEIQYGAQLTVRESQMALFVDEGKIADVFARTPQVNHPDAAVAHNLKNWDKLFQSPFNRTFYFSTRLQLNRSGAREPDQHRDKEFGAVRMRAFGIYSYKVTDPRPSI